MRVLYLILQSLGPILRLVRSTSRSHGPFAYIIINVYPFKVDARRGFVAHSVAFQIRLTLKGEASKRPQLITRTVVDHPIRPLTSHRVAKFTAPHSRAPVTHLFTHLLTDLFSVVSAVQPRFRHVEVKTRRHTTTHYRSKNAYIHTMHLNSYCCNIF